MGPNGAPTEYQALVAYEKECSERYNRFFALVGLIGDHPVMDRLQARIREQLRASDYVFVLDDGGPETARAWQIGVLLPATDPPGAAVVRARLDELFRIHDVPVMSGLSIYPDDGSSPETLLALAFAAWPGESRAERG